VSHLFLITNLIDSADLSFLTGTELPQYPLANIKDPFTTKICRVEANTVSILIDTKVLTPKDNIMLAGSTVNGLGFSSVSAYSSSTADFTGATEIPLLVSAKYNLAYATFTATNNRYWKLTFTGTGSTTEIGKIFLGQAETINSKGMSAEGFKYAYIDRSDISSNKYGNRFSTEYPKILTLAGKFSVLDQTDRDLFGDIIEVKGLTKPFFVILDPQSFYSVDSNFKLSGYFYFEALPEFSSLSVAYYTTSFSLIQAG